MQAYNQAKKLNLDEALIQILKKEIEQKLAPHSPSKSLI
ncbi:sporulation histidine kinase inhibitor Sda [Domibacillus sp. 8LH]